MSKRFIVLSTLDVKSKSFIAAGLTPDMREKDIIEGLINYMDNKGFEFMYIKAQYLIFKRR